MTQNLHITLVRALFRSSGMAMIDPCLSAITSPLLPLPLPLQLLVRRCEMG